MSATPQLMGEYQWHPMEHNQHRVYKLDDKEHYLLLGQDEKWRVCFSYNESDCGFINSKSLCPPSCETGWMYQNDESEWIDDPNLKVEPCTVTSGFLTIESDLSNYEKYGNLFGTLGGSSLCRLLKNTLFV